jgi:hypothetical protein
MRTKASSHTQYLQPQQLQQQPPRQLQLQQQLPQTTTTTTITTTTTTTTNTTATTTPTHSQPQQLGSKDMPGEGNTGATASGVHHARARVAPRGAETRHHHDCLRQHAWCSSAPLVSTGVPRSRNKMNRYRIRGSMGAVIPLPQLRQQRKLANNREVLRTRQDQTRPNTEPGRGSFFLGSLPRPGGGEVPAGSPSAIGDPSRQPQGNPHRLFSLLRKETR